jgi:hypothetical protein
MAEINIEALFTWNILTTRKKLKNSLRSGAAIPHYLN